MKCKYYKEEFCVNADCPYRADYCPVTESEEICIHNSINENKIENETIWVVNVNQNQNTYIVKAKTKTEAKDKVYNYLNEIYPPEYLKERGYTPYYKKDIETCNKLIDLLVDDILEI